MSQDLEAERKNIKEFLEYLATEISECRKLLRGEKN